jgi:mevalonate kinase
VTQRLSELHPRAVTLNSDEEFVAFIFKLGGAISNLAQQVSTVASRKNIAKRIQSIVPSGGAGAGAGASASASLAKGGRRTRRKRRQ